MSPRLWSRRGARAARVTSRARLRDVVPALALVLAAVVLLPGCIDRAFGPPAPVSETSAAPAAGASAPLAAVEALYAALASGDRASLSASVTDALLTRIDDGEFGTISAPRSFRDLGVRMQGADKALVDIAESDGGVLGGTVTFTVVSDGMWKVDSFEYTALR